MSGKKAKAKVIKLADAEVPEFLRTVYDDLAFLRSMRFERPSRTEVRISSSVLRRLLHEHMLAAAWRIAELSDQPRIAAVDLDAVIGDVPRRYIHYAYAGGAPTKRAQHSGYALLVIPKDEVSAGDYDATARDRSSTRSRSSGSEAGCSRHSRSLKRHSRPTSASTTITACIPALTTTRPKSMRDW